MTTSPDTLQDIGRLPQSLDKYMYSSRKLGNIYHIAHLHSKTLGTVVALLRSFEARKVGTGLIKEPMIRTLKGGIWKNR